MGGGKETLEEVQTSANSHAAKATEYETEAINMAGILTTDAFVLLETNVKKFAADSRKDASDAQTKTDLDACDTDRDNAERQKLSAEVEIIKMLKIFAKHAADEASRIYDDTTKRLPPNQEVAFTYDQRMAYSNMGFIVSYAQTNSNHTQLETSYWNVKHYCKSTVYHKNQAISRFNVIQSSLLQ